jgi:hypothetical protein
MPAISAGDKKKQRDRVVERFMQECMKVTKNRKIMKKMYKHGLGYMVISWDPQGSFARCNYSKHFQRFANDAEWEHGLQTLIQKMTCDKSDERVTTGSASELKDAEVAKNVADVIRRHVSQTHLLKLLRAMDAAKLRRTILKASDADHLACEVDTNDGSKENSNFEEIMADDAFKEPTEGDDEDESSRAGGY